MFGFIIRGAGYRPHFQSTCLRKAFTGEYLQGLTLGWVKDDAWIRRECTRQEEVA